MECIPDGASSASGGKLIHFLGALTLTITFKLAPLEASLKGFSNPGVLTIGALFMVAAGMYSTGAITMITEKPIGRPKSMLGAQLKILPPIAVGSAFLNNTPLVIDTIRNGTGGAAELREITMFDPSWVAVPAMILGVILLMVTSKWLLSDAGKGQAAVVSIRRYGSEFTISGTSSLKGQTLAAAGFAEPVGFELLQLIRADGASAALEPGTRLESGDVLVISSDLDTLARLWTMNGLSPLHTMKPMKTQRHDHQLVEVVVSPQSRGVGRMVSEFPLPDSPYTAPLVAVSRNDQPVAGRIADVQIEVGDVGVLEVDESFFFVNAKESEFSLVRRLRGYSIQRWDKAITASLITAAMITSAAMGWLSMLNAAMLATGAMLLSGCLTLKTSRSLTSSLMWTSRILGAALDTAISATPRP